MTSVLLAALIVVIAVAFGAARADAAPVQLRNAQSGQMMEVLADNTVALRPSKPASFRQKWEKEPFGTIGFRFRNLATNACLITPPTAIDFERLRVSACGGLGNRNLWRVHNPVKFNGAGQPVSVQTGQTPLPDRRGSCACGRRRSCLARPDLRVLRDVRPAPGRESPSPPAATTAP